MDEMGGGGPSSTQGGLWPAAGLGSLIVAGRSWDLLKEVAIIYVEFSQFSHSVTSDSATP